MRDAEGFLGDRASNTAFGSILEDWRERLRKVGEDPLGDSPDDTNKRKLDKLLVQGDFEAAGVIHSAIEEFACELAAVCWRLLQLKAWHDVAEIVVGGGFRSSRLGEIAIGRALVLLKAGGRSIKLRPIRHHPDEAGLIGCAHLAPPRTFSGCDSMIGVDIGGTKIRAGIVELNMDRHSGLRDARVRTTRQWRHGDEDPKRDDAVDRLAEMLLDLIGAAETKDCTLAPFIGIGCPGLIAEDGSIDRGGQNLPGDWESSGFNLPQRIRSATPSIGGNDTMVLMHNDAVVQGLSEAPWMQEVAHWGVLTISTGLGNASFATQRVTNSSSN